MQKASVSRAVVGLLAFAPLLSGQERAASDHSQPNVVLVMTDDQGYPDIAAHGNSMIQTPTLDALGRESVRMTDFHVDPTCSPTRSALMSGRYSTRTGVWHTIMGRSLMDGGEWTMAEALRAAGYRTGMFGKWHLGENYPMRPQDQGFEDVVCHGGGGVGQGPDWWGNDYFDDTYWRNGKPEKFDGYCTDVWFREATRFIESNKDQPFFCYLATNAPHGPYLVDEKWSAPYTEKGVGDPQAKFYGMIENIDWNLGKLLKRIDELGLADNTIFVFMTDNGTAAGGVNAKRAKTGKWAGYQAGMRGRKGSEYDGGHRVPCYIRWPGGGIGGPDRAREEPYLAAHVDLLPTLADLCHVEAQPDAHAATHPLDGISLAARLRDPNATLPERTLFVHSQRIWTPEKWRKSAVLTEQWRLVNGKELYDIRADSDQSENLAAQHPDVVAQLRAAYDGWWVSLAPAIARTVHIGIGSPAEPTALLHSHDWERVGKGGVPWHQNHVRRGAFLRGRWHVDVLEAGSYRIELRRWPRHLDKPLEAVSAEITIAGIEQKLPVEAGATHATFRVELPVGKTTLQPLLTTAEGKTRGAYFAYISRAE